MLTFENTYVPILVSNGDPLEREPTYICEKDPVELVRKFMEELEQCGKNIREKGKAALVPEGTSRLPKTQRKSGKSTIGCSRRRVCASLQTG